MKETICFTTSLCSMQNSEGPVHQRFEQRPQGGDDATAAGKVVEKLRVPFL